MDDASEDLELEARKEVDGLASDGLFNFDEGAVYVFTDREFPDKPVGSLRFQPESAFADPDALEYGFDGFSTPAEYDLGCCARAEVSPAFGFEDLGELRRIAAADGPRPVAMPLASFEEAESLHVSGEPGAVISAADAGAPSIASQCVEGESIMLPMSPALAGRIADAIEACASMDAQRAKARMLPSEWVLAERELKVAAADKAPISGAAPKEPAAAARSAREDIAAGRDGEGRGPQAHERDLKAGKSI